MTSHRLKILTGIAAVLALLAIGVGRFAWNHNERNLTIPDEKQAGLALLSQKLSGPGYFSDAKASHDDEGTWITPADARDQADRVIKERKFDETRCGKLKQLVIDLTEPPSSRIVGGDRINLVRLNLALDELPK